MLSSEEGTIVTGAGRESLMPFLASRVSGEDTDLAVKCCTQTRVGQVGDGVIVTGER